MLTLGSQIIRSTACIHINTRSCSGYVTSNESVQLTSAFYVTVKQDELTLIVALFNACKSCHLSLKQTSSRHMSSYQFPILAFGRYLPIWAIIVWQIFVYWWNSPARLQHSSYLGSRFQGNTNSPFYVLAVLANCHERAAWARVTSLSKEGFRWVVPSG